MLIRKIVALTLVFALLAIPAEASSSWYIVKRGNSTPEFPADAEFITQHGGYYVDKDSVASGDKKIYLTFDAGYENGNIERILDVLREYEIKGSFFILSNLIKKNPELVRRMAADGHLVCNHTYNHKDMTRLTKAEMLNNLARLEAEYEACTGAAMSKYFRFPEGRYNKDVILICEEAGYRPVFWSMAYDDWDNSRQQEESVALKKLLGTTHAGAIVLLHPTSSTNAKILPSLIEAWLSEGYSFATLDELK